MTRRAEFIARQVASTYDGTYVVLGSALTSPAVILKIINNSDRDLDISTDGVTDHDFVPKNGFVLYDLRANHGRLDDLLFPLGTQFYIKGSAGGSGNVYLVVIRERP